MYDAYSKFAPLPSARTILARMGVAEAPQKSVQAGDEPQTDFIPARSVNV